jgi:hypothetical protein
VRENGISGQHRNNGEIMKISVSGVISVVAANGWRNGVSMASAASSAKRWHHRENNEMAQANVTKKAAQ